MEIECEFRYSSWTAATSQSSQSSSLHYTCSIVSASTTDKFKAIKSIKGDHKNGKSNENVEAIIFISTHLECFPRGLNKIFPRLKKLRIYKCGLREICREDLIGLEGLDYFSSHTNPITTIPDDLFTNMTNLQVISFHNNQIEFASSKLFAPFKESSPHSVNLSFNATIDKRFVSSEKEGIKWLAFMQLIDTSCKRSTNTFPIGFNELRLSNCLTDFVIIVGSKEWPVHKIVLAIQSPTFKELFEQEKEAGKLIVSDSDLEAVEGFLDYLYTRKIPSSIESASRILKLAVKYKVEELKSICEDVILDRLDDTNSLEVFSIGHENCLEKLIASAFREIQYMFDGKIKDEFMNQPEIVKQLVEAQSRLNALISKVSK